MSLISNDISSLAHSKWNYKYHIVFAPKYRYGNRKFWCTGYYVDTVGRNKKVIEEYIDRLRVVMIRAKKVALCTKKEVLEIYF